MRTIGEDLKKEKRKTNEVCVLWCMSEMAREVHRKYTGAGLLFSEVKIVVLTLFLVFRAWKVC